jgi:putative SOS response-associated peptidase YedK
MLLSPEVERRRAPPLLLADRPPPVDPATGEEVLSCTMIVSGASAWMEPYHDRMPVLLEPKDFDE